MYRLVWTAAKREDDGDQSHVERPEREDGQRRPRVLGVHVDPEAGEVLVGARVAAATRGARGSSWRPNWTGWSRGRSVARGDSPCTPPSSCRRGGRPCRGSCRGRCLSRPPWQRVHRAATLARKAGVPGGRMLWASWQSAHSGALLSLLGERKLPVEGPLVHAALVRVAVLARLELGDCAASSR